VPTVSEAGVPGYDAVIWLGIMAPRERPRRSWTGSTRRFARSSIRRR
jgi:hypothetical protein